MRNRTSKARRENPLFLRNEYNGDNVYDIAVLEKSEIDEPLLQVISCKNIRDNDKVHIDRAVHFFVDDADFDKFYRDPDPYALRLAQYRCALTPDFSMLNDMPIWKQIESVAKNRWCGRYWQDLGIPIIPTVGWSTKESYDFAFLGLSIGTAVAVSTLSVHSSQMRRDAFMSGYNEMLKRIHPSAIYCYSKPFPEMAGNVIYVDYLEATNRRAG